MYDMNEVVSEPVMQDILQKVMISENFKDEENQWTWKWDFSNEWKKHLLEMTMKYYKRYVSALKNMSHDILPRGIMRKYHNLYGDQLNFYKVLLRKNLSDNISKKKMKKRVLIFRHMK